MPKKKPTPKQPPPPTPAEPVPSKDELLSDQELKFVAMYTGNQTEAAIAIGISIASAAQMGSRFMKRPAVLRALLDKQNAAMAVITARSTEIAKALFDNEIDNDLIAEKLHTIITSQPHERRNYADHIQALKIACVLLGHTAGSGKPPQPVDGGGESGVTRDGRYYFYRAPWKREQDELARGRVTLRALPSSR